MEFAKASLQKNKNPAAATQTIAKMATSGDPAVKVRTAGVEMVGCSVRFDFGSVIVD